MRPPALIVGEHNPLSSDPEHALYDLPVGCSGHRLRTRILGLSRASYHDPGLVRRVNLYDSADASVARGERRAERIVAAGSLYSVVVLLGVKVRAAFGGRPEFFRSEVRGRATLLSLPHPSGLCHEWNDECAATVARVTLRELAPHVPWGEELS